MMIPRTLVRFTGKFGSAMFVSAVSFRDGDGFKVKSVTFSKDRSKAARFHAVTADAIATQFFTHPVQTELVDGSLVKDYTPEHRKLSAEYYAKMRAEKDAFDDVLQAAILSAGKDLLDMIMAGPAVTRLAR